LSTSRDCLLGTNQDLVLRHIFHPEKKNWSWKSKA